jgi:hypothetical protein
MDQLLYRIVTPTDNFATIVLFVLVFVCCYSAFKQMRDNDRRGTPREAEESDKVQTWPYLVRIEFLGALAVMAILTVWSVLLDAPLEEPANPAITPNPSKAPWYFLGLQEMLVYFDAWIAGVVLPGLIIVGLVIIPYIDINPKGNGYYTFKERKFSITVFCLGFLVLWISLIVLGTFFRGPGWNFFWPWEYWDPHKIVAMASRDWPEVFRVPTRTIDGAIHPLGFMIGFVTIALFYSTGVFYYFRKKNAEWMKKLGVARYAMIAFLMLTMIALPLKMILRIFLNVHYVWVTPWFSV